MDQRDRLRRARPLVPNGIAERVMNSGRDRTSRSVVVVLVAAAMLFYYVNSELVPVTGRRRFNFLPDWVVRWKHRRAAADIVREIEQQGGWVLPERDWRTRKVERVMSRLIPVSGMADLDWEVFVIADNATANAFVLPGGKVFVHSGILEVCGDDDALAAVLGHEVAHMTASHQGERLSAASVGFLTTGSLFFLAGAWQGLALYGMWTLVGGLYLQELLGTLPMGRRQETEADYLGLIMTAEACYDPRQAIGFWQRMEEMTRGAGDIPEMLSTHPSNANRIKKIHEWLPRAMEKREESDCKGTMAFANRFRDAMRTRKKVIIEA